jgi:uncharacterized protein YwqG
MTPALSLVFEDKHPKGARAHQVLSVTSDAGLDAGHDRCESRATMTNSNLKAAIRAYMAENGVNYTTAKRAVEADTPRLAPASPSSPRLTAAFPFGAITVAHGPDRTRVFEDATAHFTPDHKFRHVLPAAEQTYEEFARRVLSLRRMDACDEVAVPDLDKAAEPMKVAALLFELAETGSAVVVSLDVANINAAYEFFLKAFAAKHNMAVGDAWDVLKPSMFRTLDHALLVGNAQREEQFKAEQARRTQVADRALLNAKEDVAGTRRRLAAVDPAYGDIVDGLVLPFVRMRAATGTPKPTGSYVGGYPYVPVGTPADEVWPTDPAGNPMAFVCQINFTEVAKAAKYPLDGYPTEGLLQWFLGGGDDPYGQTYDSPTTGFDGLHVRWYSAEDLKTRALHSPDTDTPTDPTIDGPLNEAGPTKVVFRAAKGLPGTCEVSEGGTPAAKTVSSLVSDIQGTWELAEAIDDTKTLAKFERLFEDFEGIWDDSDLDAPNGFGAGDKVGGYPSIVQGDPRAMHPDRAHTLLIQLDSDGGFFTTWGDGGAGWLFGDPAALAEGDTSSLWWSWACH